MSAETPGTPPPSPPPSHAGGYPISFEFVPAERIARWRPLVHWLLVIPHLIVLWLIGVVASVLMIVAWIVGVITGRIPEGLQAPLVLYLRYSQRVATYHLFMREEYPPFTFETTFADPGTDPRVRVDVVPAVEGRSRLTIFFRGLLVLPHFIVLAFVGIAAYVAVIVGWFAVLITGRWPDGLQHFVVGTLRWVARVNGYYSLLTDEYPPFSFD